MVLRCQVGYDGDPRESRGVPAAESLKRPTSRSFHTRLSAAGRCSPLALSSLSALPSYVDRTFRCARETLKHYKALLSWSTSSGPGRQRSGQGGRMRYQSPQFASTPQHSRNPCFNESGIARCVDPSGAQISVNHVVFRNIPSPGPFGIAALLPCQASGAQVPFLNASTRVALVMSLMMHRTMQVLVALRRELDLSTMTLHNVET